MIKKILKIFGFLVLIAVSAILLLAGIIWASLEWGIHQKKEEKIAYQKEVCDTMTLVSSKFTFDFSGFREKELKKVAFYIVRNGKVLNMNSAKVNSNPGDKYVSATMPFENFKTTDTIVIQAAKHYFLLSQLNYIAEQHYGMFGPVGPCDCYLANFQILNGKRLDQQSSWLLKKDGITEYKLPAAVK